MLTRYTDHWTGSEIITDGLPSNYYVLQGLQDPSDKGKFTVFTGCTLVPLLIHETGEQLTSNNLTI